MRTLSKNILVLLLGACASIPAVANTPAAPAPDQPRTMDQAVDRVISNEQRLYGQIRNYSPIVETYIQNLKADKDMGDVPAGDKYFLGRADFQKGVNLVPLSDTTSKAKKFMGSMNFFCDAISAGRLPADDFYRQQPLR